MTDYTFSEARRQNQVLKDQAYSLMNNLNFGKSPPKSRSQIKLSPSKRSPRKAPKLPYEDTLDPHGSTSPPRKPHLESPTRNQLRSVSQSNFFDEFKEKVYEIRNTQYSPQKIRDNERRDAFAPSKRSEDLFLLKIERQNERVDELEATVRQLKLQNLQLELSNESLRARADGDKGDLRRLKQELEQKESQLRHDYEVKERHLRQEFDQRERKMRQQWEILQQAQSSGRDFLVYLPQQQPLLPRQTAKPQTVANGLQLSFAQKNRSGQLELENEILRKDVRQLNARLDASNALRTNHTLKLRAKLATSMDIIRYYVNKDEEPNEWYDFGDSTQELLLGETSQTMELLKELAPRRTEKRKSLRAYCTAVLFIVRMKKDASGRNLSDQISETR
ncbi:hypothetical protein PUMCH_001816 [Australozyma saopauloensis]|uniref:Uncharacterized protein n=1 Tax=Australozyma saopauloensis TaxID=291208 RepID=A0AAX4H7R4_9ASCO|nr:hypothetical protein PUMCH_001816 [[Candida] saopauloensis]